MKGDEYIVSAKYVDAAGEACEEAINMKANEAVRSIMKEKRIGTTALAKRMGKTPRLVCDRLSQDNISIDKLMEILRLMDYKIALVPADASLPKDSYVLE